MISFLASLSLLTLAACQQQPTASQGSKSTSYKSEPSVTEYVATKSTSVSGVYPTATPMPGLGGDQFDQFNQPGASGQGIGQGIGQGFPSQIGQSGQGLFGSGSQDFNQGSSLCNEDEEEETTRPSSMGILPTRRPCRPKFSGPRTGLGTFGSTGSLGTSPVCGPMPCAPVATPVTVPSQPWGYADSALPPTINWPAILQSSCLVHAATVPECAQIYAQAQQTYCTRSANPQICELLACQVRDQCATTVGGGRMYCWNPSWMMPSVF